MWRKNTQREAIWTLPFPSSYPLIKILVSNKMGDLQSKTGRHKGLRSRKHIDLLFHKFTFSSKLMKGQQEPENHFGSWLYNYITLLPKDITPPLCISWASYQSVIEKVFHVMDTAPDPHSRLPNPLPNSSFQDTHCLAIRINLICPPS